MRVVLARAPPFGSLCMKEVKFLLKRDAGVGRIDFVDIADPAYSPDDNAGITFQAVREHRARVWGWCGAGLASVRAMR
jgi:predicted DCC family thiol-disulfide oxidoreductase YuxK